MTAYPRKDDHTVDRESLQKNGELIVTYPMFAHPYEFANIQAVAGKDANVYGLYHINHSEPEGVQDALPEYIAVELTDDAGLAYYGVAVNAGLLVFDGFYDYKGKGIKKSAAPEPVELDVPTPPPALTQPTTITTTVTDSQGNQSVSSQPVPAILPAGSPEPVADDELAPAKSAEKKPAATAKPSTSKKK